MTDLIKVTTNGHNEPICSGRELHELLKVDIDYDTWFKLLRVYGFVEGIHFVPTLEEGTGGRQKTNHTLTLDMANEVAMLQRKQQKILEKSLTSF